MKVLSSRCVASVGLACALGLHFPAGAQTPPTDAGRQLEANRPPPPTLTKDPPPRDDPLPPQRAAMAQGPVVHVNSFRLKGNTLFTVEDLLPLLQSFAGRDLDIEGLQDAADAVRGHYRRSGYFLTQVIVPAQDISGGEVALQVIEATVGSVPVNVKTNRISQALAEGYADRLTAGSPISEESVERPILLLNDLPGIQVESVLRPGTKFGNVDLALTVTDSGPTYGGDVFTDSFGTRSTGEVRIGGDFEARGLAGVGDLLSLSLLTTDLGRLNLGRILASAPVGPYGTKATASMTALEYHVPEPNVPGLQLAQGRAAVASLYFQHPISRSRNQNFFLLAGVELNAVNDIALEIEENKRRLAVAQLGVLGDFRDLLGGGAINTFSLVASIGQNDIKTPQREADDTHPVTGHFTGGRFGKIVGEGVRLQRIAPETSLLLSGRFQVSHDNLDQTQKTSLGGPRGVRAYAVGEGAGDELALCTIELRQVIPQMSLAGVPLVASVFVDGGRVRTWHSPVLSDAENSRSYTGAGVGFDLSKRNDFQIRVDVATRLGSSRRPSTSAIDEMQLWANVQKWF